MTYISILRGINVSGQKLIRMDMLREIYEGLDFRTIETYIQSGNVIFQFTKSENTDLEKIISNQIQKRFGFEVTVIILTLEEMKDIIERNPYKADKTKDIAHLYVTILSSKPEQINLETIHDVKLPGEEFELIERAVYLYCPYGYGKTKLSNTFFEKKLQVGATTRNWRTALELLNIAKSNQHNSLV
jgi:uncharacterized protein (DUF1697 family)